jgi:hypothetical protein
VFDMVVGGGTVYAAGWFTSIGGQPRNRIAALDAASGVATAWNPNASNGVYALAMSGGTIYAGGDFTSIGGQPRNYIAALDAASGAVTAWDPNPDYDIQALAVSGGTVYAGGAFTSIGGQPRNHIGAIDAVSGAADVWNPNANSVVNSVTEIGGTVYAGGVFTSIGGELRPYFAGLQPSATTAVPASHPGLSTGSELTLVAPNPTASGVQVHYVVARAGRVRLELMDVSGRVQATLADRVHTPGPYDVAWDGAVGRGRPAPGLYFIRLVAPDRTALRKLAMIR